MVAQISSETFNRTSLTPPMDDSDSDDLVLALETARALEAQGEIREAVRWLRRAADQAEQDGNDARVLVLARAAADLTNTVSNGSSPAPAQSSLPPSSAAERSSVRLPAPKPAAFAHAAPPAPRTPAPQASSRPPSAPAPVSARVSSPPPVPARIPSPRPPAASSPAPRAVPAVTSSARPTAAAPVRSTPAPASSSAATIPRGASRPAIPPRTSSAREDKVITERTLRVATLRVAIPTSSRDASVFVVRRLKAGQPLPAGTTEATLVLNGESPFVE